MPRIPGAPWVGRKLPVNGDTGCEQTFPGCDYDDEEREFLQAMDRYKRQYKRPFPSWREVLYVLKSLGYTKGGE